MDRRSFLKAGSASVAAASLTGITSMLTSMGANAAVNNDYKALVCLFFYGGMDNHDTIIPYDNSGYQRWAQIRQPILANQHNPRTRETLLPLSVINGERFGERQFALPAEFSGIHQLFETGKAAIVGNVGPLIEAATAAEIEADTVRLPSRLFSHNDQQSTWMAGATEGAKYGWGGLYADALVGGGDSTFANITTGSGELLLSGRNTIPYQLAGGRALTLDALEEVAPQLVGPLGRHFNAEYFQGSSLLRQDIAAKTQGSFSANRLFNLAVDASAEVSTPFATTRLGRQLKAVTRTIAAREHLGANRQVFSVGLGGFDTHSEQATTLPALQRQIDEAVVAFYQAMTELGLQDQVTLFTAADFGRTLATNGDGTDHGWGSHHFVVGGGVQGQQIFGDLPVADFGHPLDAGSGRLIPTQSVEQYAGALGRWFGVGDTALEQIFPQLANHGAMPALFA